MATWLVDCGGCGQHGTPCGLYRWDAERRPTYCPRGLERDGMRWTGSRLKVREIKATVTDHECTDACRRSRESKCRCACGGANHGLDATSRWATPTLKD